jgi:hypothetical protein
MSNIESFDDFNSTERMNSRYDLKPFQFRDNQNDDKETLDWLTQNFDNTESASHSRMITYRRYQALYKGIHWKPIDGRDSNRDNNHSQRKPRHSVNFVWEMTDTKVSQQARLKTNFIAMPVHNEQSDINNAKACELLLKARAEQIGMDTLQSEADTIKHLFGTVFTFITWNKDIGPEHPKVTELKEKGIPIPVLNKKTGKAESGKFIESLKVGDVEVENMGPDCVFPEMNKKKWSDVNHIEYGKWFDIDEVRADYPKLASEIKENQRHYFDYELSETSRPDRQVFVRYFFHKPTKHLPNGEFIKYTDDVILERGKFPYEHGELPFIVDTDIDIYGELWGRSFIMNIEQMQRMYNNVQSGIARDHGIGSAPKWMMPKGSAEIASLNNEFSIVEYQGPIKPELVQSRPTNAQVFTVQDRLEKKMSQQSSIYDISRGEVPAGVTANSALRFLDEQESQRTMTLESKRKRRVIQTYKMMMMVMQQYYKESDGRTVRTLGPNNEVMIKSMKQANFKQVYDIRMQNSSSLPDTKTGKISTIVDLNMSTQTDPVFSKNEIIQMLDLGMDNAFTDGATVSVESAKTICEMMLNGEQVPEPMNTDNFLVYYSVLDKTTQSMSFKLKAPDSVKAEFVKYIETLEYLMFEKAKINQKFWSKLMEIESYPMIFVPEVAVAQLAINFQPTPAAPQSGGSAGPDLSGMKAPDGAREAMIKQQMEQQA